MKLAADCGACVGLCCVAPAFVASADFAFSKPAAVACRHLDADAGCSIHHRLIPSGFPGCVAYDCFGAGQRTVALVGGARSPRMLRAYDVVRQLHELLWYVTDALCRPAAAPVHPALVAAQASIDAAVDAGPDALETTDPASHRATVAPLLRRASTLVRSFPSGTRPGAGGSAGPAPSREARVEAADPAAEQDRRGAGVAGVQWRGADLVGQDLAGRDLRRADLSTTYLIGADLRGADLRDADLLGADLRGADLSGADLTGALYLTRTQVGGARGSTATRLPDRVPLPGFWR